jgi:hypothetical protein
VKRFDATYGASPELNRVQAALQESLGSLKDKEVLDGKLVTADITTAGTDIPHGLGRNYKGYVVVRTVKSDGTKFTGSIYEDVGSDRSIFLKLDTTVNVTVTVWVF